jgi:dipeptidyl-peptidase-4
MMRRIHRVLLGFLLPGYLLVVPQSVTAQLTKKPLTVEMIFGGELSKPSPSQTVWTPDGHVSFFLPSDVGGRDLWIFDTSSGEKRLLLSADELRRLAPSPSQATSSERERTRRTRFGVPGYHWSPDGKTLLFPSSGQIILYDLSNEEATTLAPPKTGVVDPKFSPNGEHIAFVYEHDIWVVPTGGGTEKQITFGGHELLLHGDLDWVYPEELGFRTGYTWSPDSRHIAFLEMDESVVPTYPITDLLSIQATVDLQRYPKPGDPNPKVRVGIVDIETGAMAWIDRASEYIARINWVDPDTLAIQLLDRAQEELEIIHVNPTTGRSRSILTERDDHWIDVTNDLTYLKDGAEFLWTSERTGFRHIYLYERDGGLIRRLTEGDWQVGQISGLDEENGWVYFTADKDQPIGQDLYRVKLDGTGLERLTEEKGTHRIDMNPGATAYLDVFSSQTDPGRTIFETVATSAAFPFHRPLQYEELDLVSAEYKLLDTPDGATISMFLWKPKKLEKNKKYPVLVYIYGMPGASRNRDAWGGSRHLFHQLLIQNGYIVAQLDDRTGAIWGHKYAVLGDHNIGPVAIRDHEAAVDYLKSLPYVDGERMGVWGWSGGGFTTSFHMTHSNLFKVGIAGAPVTDWHLYDSIYTERYMNRPQDDPEAYERTSSVEAAKNYRGRMLLIHGTQDDNVHPQNTIQLMDALIKSRKQFDVMFYPNKTHGIRGTDEVIHLYTMIFDYLERYLK